MFWIHCCHVSRFLKQSHWKRSFLVTFFVCYCEFMYRYFDMFLNFGCFLRMLDKQARLLRKKKVGRRFFILGWSIYIENIVPAIPGYRLEQVESRLAGPARKTSWLHINVRTNLCRNDCSCLISSIVPSRLLSHPGSHISSPLVLILRIWRQMLLYLLGFDKTYAH